MQHLPYWEFSEGLRSYVLLFINDNDHSESDHVW